MPGGNRGPKKKAPRGAGLQFVLLLTDRVNRRQLRPGARDVAVTPTVRALRRIASPQAATLRLERWSLNWLRPNDSRPRVSSRLSFLTVANIERRRPVPASIAQVSCLLLLRNGCPLFASADQPSVRMIKQVGCQYIKIQLSLKVILPNRHSLRSDCIAFRRQSRCTAATCVAGMLRQRARRMRKHTPRPSGRSAASARPP
jgi:hypothetical protein